MKRKQFLLCGVKLSLYLLLLTAFSLQANGYFQAMPLTLELKNATINEIINCVRQKTNLRFLYRVEEVDVYGKRNFSVVNASVEDLMNVLLKGTDLSYEVENDVVIIKPSARKNFARPQVAEKVKGRVYDRRGQPLPGVSVSVKGTQLGVSTNIEGEFEMELPGKEEWIICFSFVGMERQEVAFHGQEPMIVVMKEDRQNLDEVVVTGYQTIRKERMTGSVSVITAQKIAESGATSIDQVLRGQLPGVSVMNISGRPGEHAQIRIRGLNSISGNMDPIWIVDGMEMQGAVPTISVGGTNLQNTIFTDGIGNISPEDIKSITVLKDAAASALYGARAANGVIVVETKRGTAGESYINISGNFSLSEAPVNHLDMMNTQEKIAYERAIYEDFPEFDIQGRVFQILQKAGKGIYTQEEARQEIEGLSKVETDWFDVIFQTAKSQRYNLSFSGGSPELQYYASATLGKEEGILKGNELTRLNTNIMLNYKPNRKVKLDFALKSSIGKDKIPNPVEDPFEYATYANPYEKPYNADGSYAYDRSWNGELDDMRDGYRYDYNILEDMESSTRKSKSVSTSVSGKFTWDIWRGISLESQVDYTYASDHGEEYARPGSMASWLGNVLRLSGAGDRLPKDKNNGYLRETSGNNEVWGIKNILKYTQDFKENHFVNVLLGQEISDKKIRNFFNLLPEYDPAYEVGGYPGSFPPGVYLSTFEFSMLGNSGRDREKLSSFFATVSYSYQDRFIAGGSIRYDGVDIIGNKNQFSPLWNISGKWNLHKESWLQQYDRLDVFAIRFSYGYTGSIDHSALPFTYLQYRYLSYYDGSLLPAEINWKNPNIKWQRKLDRNAGIDFAFLDGRLNGEFNYYNNRINDVLDNKQLPVSSGQKSVRANVASTTNKGFELSLNGVLIDAKDWRWTLNFNYNRNRSKVVRTYYNKLEELPIVQRNNAAYMSKYYVDGYDVSSWFGYRFAGVDPQTGNTLAYVNDESKVKSWEIHSEKEGRKIIDMDRNFNHAATISYIGRQYPDKTGGFGTMVKYKSLSLNAQFAFMAGNRIKSARYTSPSDMFATNMNRLRSDLNRWRQPGDITDIPEFRRRTQKYAYNQYFFDNEVERGNYLKMTYLTLDWHLPRLFVGKMGLSRCKLSFNAQNLFTFTKYKGIDPENNGAFHYPSARKYTLSLDINI